MKVISHVVALSNNSVIGVDNNLPWNLKTDLLHFKEYTTNKIIIMGRKTYESIGKALPGRKNIVITANEAYTLNDALVANSCDQALRIASVESDEVMIIGGGKIYETMLPLATTLFLTFIDLEVDGDTQFPDYSKSAKWKEISRESFNSDEKNPYNYQFITLSKITL